jgi:hypothetical protein
MISKLHQRLGTAGFIIAIVALVAALGGGAYAASGGLTGKQKKEVEKIAKSVSKPGKTGATGPAGPAGAQGSAGGKGDQGATGAPGSPGAPGEEGERGPVGSPWTAGGTLPAGKTETGSWVVLGEGSLGLAQISFPIPLTEAAANAIDSAHVHYVAVGDVVPAGCADGTAAAPAAAPGNLCVYEAAGEFENPPFILKSAAAGVEFGASTAGAVLFGEGPLGGSLGDVAGTWAVTAPES